VTFATPVSDRARAGVHTLRWPAAAALTLLAHAAAVWAVVGWRSAVVAPSDPPPAVVIDLSPVAPSSTAPERSVADGPQMTEATPSPSDRAAERTMQAAAPHPNPLVPDAPAEAPAPERPVAVENPATRPEPPTAEPPPETKADSRPQPAQPIETQAPPAPQPPSPELRIYPFRLASPRKLNLRPPPPRSKRRRRPLRRARPSCRSLQTPHVKNQPMRHLSRSLPSLSQKLPRRRRQSRSSYLRQRRRPPILRAGRLRRRISVWSERNPPKSTIGRRQITPGLQRDRPRQRRGRPRRPIQAAAQAWPRRLRPGRGSLSRTSIASSASRRMPRRAGLHRSLLRSIAREPWCRRA
jgi:hypothetical protein